MADLITCQWEAPTPATVSRIRMMHWECRRPTFKCFRHITQRHSDASHDAYGRRILQRNSSHWLKDHQRKTEREKDWEGQSTTFHPPARHPSLPINKWNECRRSSRLLIAPGSPSDFALVTSRLSCVAIDLYVASDLRGLLLPLIKNGIRKNEKLWGGGAEIGLQSYRKGRLKLYTSENDNGRFLRNGGNPYKLR